MTLPYFDQLFLPVLKVLSVTEVMTRPEIRDSVASKLGLSEEALRELVPSGRQRTFDGRVGWAVTYLHKAGLIERVQRGVYRISERGREIVRENPKTLSLDDLKKEEPLRIWLEAANKRSSGEQVDTSVSTEIGFRREDDGSTPLELMESAYLALRESLADEVLEALHGVSWQRFEEIVIDVLLALGYGGNRREAGQAFKTTADHGVDGVIHEDRLGLSKIYVQAKRYTTGTPVGRPEVQAFAGSLLGVRSNLGIFITTSRFTKSAEDYAESLSAQKVVLINGVTLAGHMIDQGVGVSVEETYFLRKLDGDYFE